MRVSSTGDGRAPGLPLEALLHAVPGMVALLEGPGLIIRFANSRLGELGGGRPLVDHPLGSALPELRWLLPTLSTVRETGERQELRGRAVRRPAPETSEEVERLYDVVIEPLPRAGAEVDLALFVQDVTDRPRVDQIEKDAAQRTTLSSSGRAALAGDSDASSWAEEALKASEDRFRALVTASADILYRMSPDWTEMRQLNSRGFVADSEQPSSAWLDEYIPPDELPRLSAAVDEAIRTKSIFELEHRVRRADGSLGWTASRAVPLLDAQGEIIEWFGSASDITERKRVEETLRESEERFRELADGLPLIVWVHDAEGNQELVNQTFCEFFGVSREEMKGGRWQMLMHPDDADSYTSEFLRCVRTRRRFHAEVRVKRTDGQWRHIESWARPRFTRDGEFRGFIGTSADVTERKRVDAALHESERRLRKSDRRKDEFLAMLGHELRNPLAAISNAAHVIKLVQPDDGRIGRAYGVLERQSAHMTRLIDGLLEVSRIKQGKIHLNPEILDVRTVLEQVLQDRAAYATSRGLALSRDFPPEPLWASADRVRLEQVFDNLIGNALKFTASPGSVSVRLQEEAGAALVSVRDTGAGIRPELLSDIFEPFQQEAQDAARAAGGLGLGLAVAKGLVELHRGTISAHSMGPGTGAEFVVRLARASAPPVVREPAPRAAGRQRRILLVEDNADAAVVLRDLLEIEGHEVSVASTGPHALETLRRDGADVVICDIGLPGMSGYDVARAIREDDRLRGTALVALTGYGQPEDHQRSIEAGFDEHLTKPIDLDALRDVLTRPHPAPPAASVAREAERWAGRNYHCRTHPDRGFPSVRRGLHCAQPLASRSLSYLCSCLTAISPSTPNSRGPSVSLRLAGRPRRQHCAAKREE